MFCLLLIVSHLLVLPSRSRQKKKKRKKRKRKTKRRGCRAGGWGGVGVQPTLAGLTRNGRGSGAFCELFESSSLQRHQSEAELYCITGTYRYGITCTSRYGVNGTPQYNITSTPWCSITGKLRHEVFVILYRFDCSKPV